MKRRWVIGACAIVLIIDVQQPGRFRGGLPLFSSLGDVKKEYSKAAGRIEEELQEEVDKVMPEPQPNAEPQEPPCRMTAEDISRGCTREDINLGRSPQSGVI